MPSHSEGLGIWVSVWRFLLTHCLYERAAKVLARLRGCAGSPEPSLLAYVISTKFAWRGPNDLIPCGIPTQDDPLSERLCSNLDFSHGLLLITYVKVFTPLLFSLRSYTESILIVYCRSFSVITYNPNHNTLNFKWLIFLPVVINSFRAIVAEMRLLGRAPLSH